MEQTFILNFLTQYKLWILAGVPADNRYDFNTGYGLCGNLVRYCYIVFDELANSYRDVHEYAADACGVLDNMLIADGLETDYPFGQDQFMRDCDACTHHIHEPRLEWIRLKLELPYNQTATGV